MHSGWTSISCFCFEAHPIMESATFPTTYSWLDLVFTVIGVCTFLFDVGSDLWVAKEFYKHGDFMWFGVLVGFMLMSSVVVQLFSWFWLQYDRHLKDFEPQASSGNTVLFCEAKRVKLLLLLHLCHMGYLVRWDWSNFNHERGRLLIFFFFQMLNISIYFKSFK